MILLYTLVLKFATSWSVDIHTPTILDAQPEQKSVECFVLVCHVVGLKVVLVVACYELVVEGYEFRL